LFQPKIFKPKGVKLNSNVKTDNSGVWVFYLVFFGFLVGEGFLVGFIVKVIADRWIGVQWLGPYLAWVLFILGGVLLALFELSKTTEGERIRDPILRLACLLQRKARVLGFIVNSIVLGPLAAAVALKNIGHSYQRTLIFVSAILFASFWVPLFVAVWH
jgi:hypothetical protein